MSAGRAAMTGFARMFPGLAGGAVVGGTVVGGAVVGGAVVGGAVVGGTVVGGTVGVGLGVGEVPAVMAMATVALWFQLAIATPLTPSITMRTKTTAAVVNPGKLRSPRVARCELFPAFPSGCCGPAELI
ncbi:hypothetical protein [Arthrobacter sp. BF1]|uniref:hypothetical protein n=1 Tax=Arthrobacter sp. BF1 TaxID=2821145 RepID=UPI001C5018DC|nr:hypothetical protein [Arthrobacter sp. BF1]